MEAEMQPAADQMTAVTSHPALERLDRGQFLRIEGARGRTLVVFDGLVWITQAGDPRDAFVAGGGAFTFDRPGLAIVEALEESRLAMLAAVEELRAANERALA
jgi:hypothetical protein